MPAGPGETHLTTLYADIHYYFSHPSAKPIHHRFDRGSYLYLFYDAANRRARLEIANHPGTVDQDAFSGYLAPGVSLTYTYKQPSLCSIKVGSSQTHAHDQWHLPAFDVRNEQKSMYRIDSVDIYLWTEKDSATLLGHLKAVIPAHLTDIRDAPSAMARQPSEHRDSMSSTVQQLEKTAIGTAFPPRAESTTSSGSLPGPPGAPPVSQVQHLPYNPAAPAAPEPISYREKTPPPPDNGTGTGLVDTGRYDYNAQTQFPTQPATFGPNSAQHTPQQAYFPDATPQQEQPLQHQDRIPSFANPPGASLTAGTPHAIGHSPQLPQPPPVQENVSPPPPPQQQRQQQQTPPSFAPPPAQPQYLQQQPSGPPVTQYANYNPQQRAPSFGPNAIASPGLTGPPTQEPPTPSAPPAYSAALQSPGLSGQSPNSQPHPAQQEVFSYSNYSYSNPQASQQHLQQQFHNSAGGGYSGNIHSQVYRPSEAEALSGHGHGAKPKPARTNTSESRQTIENRVNGVEKKMGAFLKKLDRMI